jgi:uncharacterized protein with von Willebrand factor type A (vWA) domain
LLKDITLSDTLRGKGFLRRVSLGHQLLNQSMIFLGSKALMDRVNAGLKGKTISRAGIINFLEAMREAGVLKGVERTGKGGHRWIYSPAMNESEFKQNIARTILESLMRSFPEETKTTIKASMG